MEGPSNMFDDISAAENALNPVVHRICKFVKIRELHSISLVCKFWHDEARREIRKRGPERLLIPDIYNDQITKRNSNFHVDQLLNAKPYVALLFVGPSTRERNNRNLETDIINTYKTHFARHLVAIGVDESLMDEEVIKSCPGLLGSPNGILGLFLPLYRDTKIKIVSSKYSHSQSADELIAKLIPEDTESKSTILMFGNSYMCGFNADEILNSIKTRFAQKMYTLWGGIFDDKLMAIDCKTTHNVQNQQTAICAICISGPNIKSWSIVIDCYIKKQEVDEKLQFFRDNLQLKRNSIGLACGPRYVEDRNNPSLKNVYCNSHELMNAVKKIFPNMPFIGIFNFGYHPHFGVNSLIDDCKQKLSHKMALSLMVLTYD